jgi:hypothetical protein
MLGLGKATPLEWCPTVVGSTLGDLGREAEVVGCSGSVEPQYQELLDCVWISNRE